MNTSKTATKTAKNVDEIKVHPSKMSSAISYFMADEIHWATDRMSATINVEGEAQFVIELSKPTILNLKTAPESVLKAVLAESRLSKAEKTLIQKRLGPQKNLLEMEVSTVNGFYRAIKMVEAAEKINFEVELNGRWYPVPVVATMYPGFLGMTCWLDIKTMVADEPMTWFFKVNDSTFLQDNKVKKIKVREVLKELGLRPVNKESLTEYQAKKSLMEKLSKQAGKVMDVTSPVLVVNKFLWFSSLQPVPLGTEKKSKLLIIEDQLESKQTDRYDRYNDQQLWELPFVRTFSPDMKKYVYADVADLQEHSFDVTGRDRLVLPADMKKVLNAVFETHTDDVFGDMFRGRHGGMVILANGPSGVGKTLTAEVYSEYTNRPLYVLEMGELGTSLDSVEENLQRIFTRAARWNAILLFDEADIFLSKRGEDLDRSAIVGVFLRLLDMYDGTFFLTTNRAEVMDPAFKSRITLKLDYPELSSDSRTKIWNSLLFAAGFTIDKGVLTEEIVAEGLNGRQIRNLVRLLKVLQPGKKVTTAQIRDTFKYAAR